MKMKRLAYTAIICFSGSSNSQTIRSMSCVAALSTSPSSSSSPKVAVIGAGAAGLAAARVLSRQGIKPVVLEQDPTCGGVWRYETKESSSSRRRRRPMYKGLRTNLPKELMAFRERPFSSSLSSSGDDDSFITHRQVQDYLEDFQSHFELDQYIRYGCTVTHLSSVAHSSSVISPKTETWPKFKVQWKSSSTSTRFEDEPEEDIFDSVLICNGHYAKGSSPHIPGVSDYFRGQKVMHSIEYDDPIEFIGQTVLCIGGRASGADLAREIALHAKHVYLSDSTCTVAQSAGNVSLVPRTSQVTESGAVHFAQNCQLTPDDVDTIIFCSGYDYSFPFIDAKKTTAAASDNFELGVVPGERRVMPLYEQLWHATMPSLAFVGLPHSVVPFPLFELQAEAVVAQWQQDDGGTTAPSLLPSLKERQACATKDATSGGPNGGGRIQDTHFFGDAQWDYCRRLARLAGNYDESLEAYIATNKEIYDHAGAARKAGSPGGPDLYRSIRYNRRWDQWSVVEPTAADQRAVDGLISP